MSIFKTFSETMGAVYAKYYIDFGEMKALDFVFGSGVSLFALNTLYEGFVIDGIDAMDKIPQDKKDKYWQTACIYYQELPERLKASKAFYTLELITSNF